MKKYHDLIIDSFCDNIHLFVQTVGFVPSQVRRNYRLGSYGDIDILLLGERNKVVVIEVKGHSGLLPKFEKKQLPKYREQFPNADYYALVGNPQRSLDPQDFEFRRYV